MRDFARSDDPFVQEQLDRIAALPQPDGRIGLDAIRQLLARLGDPQLRMPPAFHVAGTNGKGSTLAFLRAMMEAQGLSVHATTSPHLVRYNERIRIAGKLIEDAELGPLLREVLDAGKDLQASFFETTIAASFLAFSRHPADACTIEVGLGGRLDATNILERPAACCVASLGLDHERFLLAEEAGAPTEPMARIAWEKASIARPGVPLVTQAYCPEAEREIARLAQERGAPLFMRGRDWQAKISESIVYRDTQGELTLPLPSLRGRHQADNAALAVAMLRHQGLVAVSSEAMAKGIRAARWPARLQRLKAGPLTAALPEATFLLDGGHNPDAAHAIAAYLRDEVRDPVHAIVGILANKDAESFLQIIAPELSQLTAVPVPGHDGHSPFELVRLAAKAGVGTIGTASGIEHALAKIAKQGRPGDEFYGTVLITGTLYLAGEVLRLNREFPD
jgi:dihydrofolate synthase/folylpolyglutamate synthase